MPRNPRVYSHWRAPLTRAGHRDALGLPGHVRVVYAGVRARTLAEAIRSLADAGYPSYPGDVEGATGYQQEAMLEAGLFAGLGDVLLWPTGRDAGEVARIVRVTGADTAVTVATYMPDLDRPGRIVVTR